MRAALLNIFICALLLNLAGCSSLLASLRGEDEATSPLASDRAPSSNGRGIVVDNGGNPENARLANQSEAVGSNLGANEFANRSKLSDDKAARGFRRQADPWEGTGPVNEGSLWNGDGQDNFYFTRNTRKKLGDIVLVKLEPDVIEAMNSKINTLLSRSLPRQVVADEAGSKASEAVSDRVGTALNSPNLGRAAGDTVNNRVVAALDRKENHIDIDEIPVRLVETLPRSSFRVEGSRRVNVRGAPYMLKISGVIRDEDIAGTGSIATSKVFDSKMELTR